MGIPEIDDACSNCGHHGYSHRSVGPFSCMIGDCLCKEFIWKKQIIKQRNGSPEFYKLLDEAAEIHNKKSADYATNTDPLGNYRYAGELAKRFNDPTDAGLMGRFAEKLQRVINLEGKSPVNESIEDTENDMLVIIALFISNRRKRRARES